MDLERERGITIGAAHSVTLYYKAAMGLPISELLLIPRLLR
jgi:translation elongation factor EF-4